MEHKSGTSETNHEERRHALALSNEGTSVARKAGTEIEEDWLSQATGDPAFWLKEAASTSKG